MSINLIIVGVGGLGREVLDYANDTAKQTGQFSIKGFLDDNPDALCNGNFNLSVPVIGDSYSYQVQDDDRFLVAVAEPDIRKSIVARLEAKGARFMSVVHPRAYVSPSASLGNGCMISPFATVATNTKLGDHVVLGFYAHVGHDAIVGNYSILSPYAAINGNSVIGERGFLGTHAVITPGTTAGSSVQISAGSVLYSDVPNNRIAIGNPAKAGPRMPTLKPKDKVKIAS